MQLQILIHTPSQKGLEFPGGGGGGGGFVRPKKLKKSMKLNRNFQGCVCGEVVLEKNPSVGEVWIFSATTQF